jgi:hypothetical protein
MTGLLRQRFLALLVTLALLLVAYPLLADTAGGRLSFNALLTSVVIATLPVLFIARRLRLLAVLLAVPTVAGVWTRYALSGFARLPLMNGAFHVVAALFLALTIAAILRAIFRQETVSADAIYGAFCGYLLVGVAFSHVYCLLEAASPGAFEEKVDVTTRRQDYEHRHFTLVYFSLITLTTVGYGDITPASEPARGFAVIEAILGQFYIAVLIAGLIGKMVSQPAPGRGPDSSG